MDRAQLVGLLKDWGIAFGITLGVLGVWRLLTPAPVSEGAAPALVLPFTDGSAFDLADQDADAYVINFWATWCGPCRQEIPEFSAFAESRPDVGVYGVSVDDGLSPLQLAATAKRLGVRYPVLHDALHEAAREWGVQSYPTTFVLDADLHIIGVRVGVMDRRRLEALVSEATDS